MLGGAIMGALWRHRRHLGRQVRPAGCLQNFLILPLTMLSGVFYSIHSLPAFWQQVSQFNPVFYMIDGFRYGFFGSPTCRR